MEDTRKRCEDEMRFKDRGIEEMCIRQVERPCSVKLKFEAMSITDVERWIHKRIIYTQHIPEKHFCKGCTSLYILA